MVNDIISTAFEGNLKALPPKIADLAGSSIKGYVQGMGDISLQEEITKTGLGVILDQVPDLLAKKEKQKKEQKSSTGQWQRVHAPERYLIDDAKIVDKASYSESKMGGRIGGLIVNDKEICLAGFALTQIEYTTYTVYPSQLSEEERRKIQELTAKRKKKYRCTIL